MNGNEFIARIKKIAKKREVPAHFDPLRGKGSHGTLFYGDKLTVVKDRKKEISRPLLHVMLKQLGLGKEDLE